MHDVVCSLSYMLYSIIQCLDGWVESLEPYLIWMDDCTELFVFSVSCNKSSGNIFCPYFFLQQFSFCFWLGSWYMNFWSWWGNILSEATSELKWINCVLLFTQFFSNWFLLNHLKNFFSGWKINSYLVNYDM